tara:strand:- start:555 stop:863 length:309 start_codon:yes stop_codon:yes gene_type:complete
MAFKGTAGKSASGASMSQYDVEVEGRLQKLEKALAALENSIAGKVDNGSYDELVDVVGTHTQQITQIAENQTSISTEEVTTYSFNELKSRLRKAFPGQFKDL